MLLLTCICETELYIVEPSPHLVVVEPGHKDLRQFQNTESDVDRTVELHTRYVVLNKH